MILLIFAYSKAPWANLIVNPPPPGKVTVFWSYYAKVCASLLLSGQSSARKQREKGFGVLGGCCVDTSLAIWQGGLCLTV
jgi:hypothetical protein